MANNIEEKSEKFFNENEDKNNNEKEKDDKKKEKLIDPLSLLSSDLLKEINYIDEKKFWRKKRKC